jgi:peroxiredoxin Q/BCP
MSHEPARSRAIEGASHMRWIAICVSALVIVATLAFVALVRAQQPMPGQPELKVGDMAPDFTLPASDGQSYTLSKLRGRTVVLAWFPKAFTGG